MKKKLFVGMAAIIGLVSVFMPACGTQEAATISDASINAAGELVLKYTDDTTENLGIIKGNNGTNGVGISSAKINDEGELVLSYTDGTEANLGKVTGSDGTDGKDGSKITIGQNGHLLIDGYDSFYLVGKKDTISIDPNGKKLAVGDTETITINNVPAVSPVDNIQSLENKGEHYYFNEPCTLTYQHKITYDDNGNLQIYRTCIRNVNDVYTFYESLIKGEDYPNNGVALTIDTTDLTSIISNYRIYYNSGVGDYRQPGVQKGQATLYMSTVITFPDGREYDVTIQFDESLSEEYFFGHDDYISTDRNFKNAVEDGKAFLTESKMVVPDVMRYSGAHHDDTSFGFYLQYISPKVDESQISIIDYYQYASAYITVKDCDLDTDYGHISTEESELVLGQIYELLKDRFVVYDVDYSLEKYNKTLEE
jgi:hypothetical protein